MGYKNKRYTRKNGRPKKRASRWQRAAFDTGAYWAQVCFLASQGDREAAIFARAKLDRAKWDAETRLQQAAYRLTGRGVLSNVMYLMPPDPFTEEEQKRATEKQPVQGRFDSGMG